MSMKNRFAGKCRSYLVFFLLAAVAALLFFPRVASAAAKPTAKQLKVTYRGFEYDNDTAKLYLKLSLKNTSSYTITKVKMGYEIPIMEDGTITQTFSAALQNIWNRILITIQSLRKQTEMRIRILQMQSHMQPA